MFTFNAKTSGIVSKHSISSYVAYQIGILRETIFIYDKQYGLR